MHKKKRKKERERKRFHFIHSCVCSFVPSLTRHVSSFLFLKSSSIALYYFIKCVYMYLFMYVTQRFMFGGQYNILFNISQFTVTDCENFTVCTQSITGKSNYNDSSKIEKESQMLTVYRRSKSSLFSTCIQLPYSCLVILFLIIL